MRILIAEDNRTSRRLLEITLQKWGYEVVSSTNGSDAWEKLKEEDAPQLLIFDWMMPGLDGVEICRKLREADPQAVRYIILLTTRDGMEDLVEGLESGADDYITKPFDKNELKARLRVGIRVLQLQTELKQKVDDLQEAIKHIKTLQGMIPICMHCHKIRDEEDVWQRFENYISEHTEALFSHGLCPECKIKHYPDLFPELVAAQKEDEPQED